MRLLLTLIALAAMASGETTDEDRKRIATAVSASYYHPDQLQGMECDLGVDPVELARRGNLPAGTSLEGTTIHVRAIRGISPNAQIRYPVVKASLDQVNRFLTQAIGTFFDVYWMAAASSVALPADSFFDVTDRDGGGYLLKIEGDNRTTLETDANYVPIKRATEYALMNRHGVLDLVVETNAPRRVRSVTFDLQNGSYKLKGKIGMDYQSVDGIHIPKHATVSASGPALRIDLNGCTVRK